MRKTIQKLLSVGLAASMIVGLAACGNNNNSTNPTPTTAQQSGGQQGGTSSTNPTSAPNQSYTELKTLKIMMDGTVFTLANGRDELEKALEKVMGVDIEFIQPDHSGYSDSVSQTFSNPDLNQWPDIVLLPTVLYTSYAGQGVLVDITDAYNKSSLSSSGRVKANALDGFYINGKLYGIGPTRGNGCLTYVKKAWMDKAGVTSTPTNYAEYTAMLEKFVSLSPDGYALTSPGIMTNEAPYVNYMPEFFWQAYPDFYKKDGKWVDGFTEDIMLDALERLHDAFQDGYIDPEYATNKTSTCRDKFYADKCGVFTYWAGTWANNLKTNLEAKGVDGELVAMAPIKEVGSYLERYTPTWAITQACANRGYDIQKVFDVFFGTMLDGGEGQVLWTYGVEGVHWGTEPETITVGEGEKAKTHDFSAGGFHFKANLETNAALYTKNHMDPLLAIVSFQPGKDVAEGSAAAVAEVAKAAQEVFNNNCHIAPVMAMGDVVNQYQSEIMALKLQLVSMVVAGEISIEDAMARYNAEVGDKVKAILDDLNK